MSEFNKHLAKIDAQAVTRFDQELQELRLVWDNSCDEDRKQLMYSLSAVSEHEGRLQSIWNLSLRIRICHDFCDHEGEPIYHGSAELKPSVMLRAIEAWERNEEFTPESVLQLL